MSKEPEESPQIPDSVRDGWDDVSFAGVALMLLVFLVAVGNLVVALIIGFGN